MMHYACDSTCRLHCPCFVTRGPYSAFLFPFLVFLPLLYLSKLFCIFCNIKWSYSSCLPRMSLPLMWKIFLIQCNLQLHCHVAILLIIPWFLSAVCSNPPFRYSITPDTGLLLMSEPCVMSVTLSNSQLGLVRFLSTVPGDYFLPLSRMRGGHFNY